MLSHFPEIRDEESTYSIFARLQFALQPTSSDIIGTMLFNRRTEAGRLNFQNSFNYLCSNLPSTFTPELFLYRNTIFPVFIPFLSIEKQGKALEYFKGAYPDKINRYLILNNNNNGKKTFIRICRECIKEDFQIYGEPYYRRQHEIELNKMCHKHQIPLYEYTISNYRLPRRYEDYYTVLSNSKELMIPREFKEKCSSITEDINTIFTSNLDNWDIKITKNKISNRLKETGYLSINGLKSQQKICEDFKKYYSEGFLDYIGYNFDINSDHTWLEKATRNYPTDPLKFILLIRFLFDNFKDFYQYNKEFSVFRKGPYPCLNSICPNYNKLVIKEILKTYKHDATQVATFKCDYCGFTYSRTGPDKNDKDIYTKTYIKNRGHLWHSKLKEYALSDLNSKEISKIFNGDYYAIKLLSAKYRNSNPIINNKTQLNNEPDDLLIKCYKNEVLRLIKEDPSTTRKIIYELNPKVYCYLLANDSAWISSIIPLVINNKTISKEEKLNNFWIKKDDFLSKELVEAINKIKSEKTPHKRISHCILEKYIGYDHMYRHRNRLPKCFEILDKACETTLDYRKRRVRYVMKELANNNIKITVFKVLRGAYSDGEENKNQEIYDYARKMVEEFNNGNINIIEDIIN